MTSSTQSGSVSHNTPGSSAAGVEESPQFDQLSLCCAEFFALNHETWSTKIRNEYDAKLEHMRCDFITDLDDLKGMRNEGTREHLQKALKNDYDKEVKDMEFSRSKDLANVTPSMKVEQRRIQNSIMGLLKKADQYPGDRKESNLTNKAAQSNEALAPTNNDELVQKLQISEERNRILERKNDEKQRELNQERIDHQEAARNYRVAATNCREVANNYRKAAKERDEYRQKLFAQKPLFEVGFQVRQGKLDSYRRDLGRSYIPVHISNRNKKCHDGAIDEDRCMVNTSDLSSREDSRLDIMKIYRFPAWTDEPIGSVHKKIVNMIGNLTYHDFFEKANETEKARVSKLSDDAWDTAKRILESYHLDRAAAMEDIDAELKGTHDELANITNNVVKEYMDTKYPNQEGGRGGCHGVARKQ